jgi:hypothetical protein
MGGLAGFGNWPPLNDNVAQLPRKAGSVADHGRVVDLLGNRSGRYCYRCTKVWQSKRLIKALSDAG